MRSRGTQGSATITRVLLAVGLLLGLVVTSSTGTASAGESVPSFAKVFQLDEIGPGSTSTLVFTITQGAGSGATDLAFSDTLPADVTISTTPAVFNTCGGTVSAPGGGSTITLTGGVVQASSSCTIKVNVTSSTAGTHENTSGDLTSSAGNSGTATDTLTVDVGRPGFSKSFDPSTVAFGGRSTLTFLIDNTANAGASSLLDFTDNLPPGMTVANPSNKATTCGNASASQVTATPGSSTIVFDSNVFSVALGAGASCTVSVDVVGGAVGALQNVSQDLQEFNGVTVEEAGKAAATLTVNPIGSLLDISKSFTDDPVPPGGQVTLEFTITNRSRDDSATGIAFADVLPAGLTFSSAGAATCDGTLDTSTPGELSYSGASLAPEASCTIAVILDVPSTTDTGVYANTTTNVEGDVGGSPVTGNQAGDVLYVVSFPILTKEFTDDPVGSGGTVTIEFTITNPETDSTMSDIEFLDELTDGSGAFPPDPTSGFLPFPVTVASPTLPAAVCGGTLDLVTFGTDRQALQFTGGSLAAAGSPGDSCTITVGVEIPIGFPAGTYTNTTEEISATLDGLAGTPTAIGPAASDDVVVLAAPMLTKEFTDDPVAPDDPVTLTFTLDNLDPDNEATDIAFTDDLAATLPGLTATTVDFNDCGATVDLSTPSDIVVFGGALAADSSCTITLTLDTPPGSSGQHLNETSTITATVLGVPVEGLEAEDTLVVAGLVLSKVFDPPNAIAGQDVDLVFTLDNTSGTENATAISFTDDLSQILAGPPDVTIVSTPVNPVCGGTLTPIGSTFLFFSGGSVDAGDSCSFTVVVNVPVGATDDEYVNITSSLTATIGGAGAVLPPAVAPLTVQTEIIALTKEFTDDPALPGGTAELQFTIENLSATETITDIAFDDDLDATLSGLEASGATFNDCGGMASGFPAGLFEYAGGTLAPGASCTIVLTLDVPAGPFAGNAFPNTTTASAGKVGLLDVTGNAASDTLLVDTVTFTKSFDGATTATGTAELSFTITNLDATSGVGAISFFDDLGAVLPGLFASGLPADPCGAGSTLSGASFLTLTGGNLPPGGSCTFAVTVNVPAGTAAGDHPNTTSELTSGGLRIADPTSDTLTIEPPPTFTKEFSPDTIVAGNDSTLTFTIDNTASALAATNLDFTDVLPAGVFVIVPGSGITDCTGGTLDTTSEDTIDYEGGEVAAGASCTISVDVTSAVADIYVNTTSDLTSTSGNSGTASDTLTVTPPPPPGFTKEFSPDTITEGDVTTLTFTINNTAALVPATALDFTDVLPAGVIVATPSNATTDCTGGTLTSANGSDTISYSGGEVAAGASCTVSVDVTSVVAGAPVNTTGDLTSSSGNSGTATDTLNVEAIPPTFSKEFDPDTVTEGDVTTLTFTIDNTASANTATSLDFTDVLPAGVVVATPSNATTDCTGGTLTSANGSDTISYSGGEVAPGATCTVEVDVLGATVGDKDNLSGDLTSSSGNSGTAADTLTVTPIPPDFAKEFDPDTISEGDSSTLGFTIDNTASTATATALDFTDVLPAGVVVATPSNKATTCTGGMVDAPDGGDTISYSGGEVAPGATCTVSVDVTSTDVGEYDNLSGDLTSSSGNSGTAADTLTVTETQPFTTVTGKRYADTRIGGTTFDGLFQGAGPRPAGSTYEVLIAGRGLVPADAVGAIINVTSVGSSPPPGFFTVFDCGALPTASALNYVAGVDVANEIFAELSATGTICVYTFAQSDILIDVVGFVQADDTVKLLDAARLAESREGAPTIDGIMAGFGRTTAGSVTTIPVADRGGVPASAKAVIVNVAAVDPDDTSFLSVFPCTPGPPPPPTSTINYTAGVNRANQVIAEVSPAGEICIYTDTDIDLIVDVYGYVEPDSTLVMFGPERFGDTRGGPTIDGLNSGGGPLAPGTTYEVQITGRDSVPAGADVVVANVVAVDPLEAGFFTVTGCVVPTPNASSLNYTAGVNGANELVVELSDDGKICIFTSGATDVLVDVVGYVPDP